jgi:hypothetical protein
MKIGISTQVYKRREINLAFCLMVERLQKSFPDLFLPIAVYSLPGDNDIFESFGIQCYQYKNEPLGEKFNYAIQQLEGKVTHVFYIDSDDIVDDSFIENLISRSDADIARCMGVYFLCVDHKTAYNGKARFLDNTYRNYGATAVLYNSRLLDKTGWKIYQGFENDKMGYMSAEFMNPFINTVEIFRLDATKSILLDIKSSTNMNLFNQFSSTGKEVDPELIFQKFSEKEVNYLKSLINGNNTSEN